jgi:hypothetical protein
VKEEDSVAGLKDKVNEFADIAKSLPENLQVSCFQLLLQHHLEGSRGHDANRTAEKVQTPEPEGKPTPESSPIPADTSKQKDFKLASLPIKAKKFVGDHSLTIDQVNNLFFEEDGDVKPIYDDLKTTKTAESQIRIALLGGFKNALKAGEFDVILQAVREECTERKCYDSSNFLSNFRNRKSYFDFAQLNTDTKHFRLSAIGKKALAELVKELQ